MGIPITALDQYGFIDDVKAYQLPPNAWSSARNVRFIAGSAWASYGHQVVLGVPQVPAYYIHSTLDIGQTPIFAYCGLSEIWATDGTTHLEITRAAGDYTGTDQNLWTVSDFGAITIFNNGVDVPQAWINRQLSQQLVNLANWPSTYRAKMLRAYRRFLFAMDITVSGVRNPQLFKWSTQADPNAVPSTWDPADETEDAGEYPLIDTPGEILDGLALGDVFCIYKTDAMYLARYIGGTFVLDLPLQFRDFGMIAQRCVGEWRKQHIVVTEDNLFKHDGFRQTGLLDRRTRRWLSSRIDPANYFKTFLVINQAEDEGWICFPENGSNYATVALIVNLHTGAAVPRDLPSVTHIEYNRTTALTGTTFDSQTTAFDSMVGYFGQSVSSLVKKRLIGTSPQVMRNLLRYSSQIDNAAWNKIAMTITANAGTDPELATPSIDRLVPTAVNSIHSTFQANAKLVADTASVYLTGRFRADGYRYVRLVIDDNGGTNLVYGTFDLQTGTVVNQLAQGNFSGALATIESLGSSYYRCTIRGNTNISINLVGHVYVLNNSQQLTYTGSGTDGILAGGLELREGAISNTHQETTSVSATSAFYLFDATYQFDGVNFVCYFERTGLAVSGRNLDGSPRSDATIKKFFQAVWPKLQMINGQTIQIQAGGQEFPDGPVTWTALQNFDPSIDLFIDINMECRYEAVRFQSSAQEFWRLAEYDLEISRIGRL